MLTAIIPILMIVIGILMFALATSPKVQRIGEWMFASGFLAIAIAYSGKMVTLLSGK